MRTPFDLADELCVRRQFDAGDVIVRQGDDAESAFVLLSGKAAVRVQEDGSSERQIGEIRAGDLFGESSLTPGSTRSATVTASQPTEILEIDRTSLDRLAREQPEVISELEEILRRHALVDFLTRQSPFANLPVMGRSALAELLVPRECEPAAVLFAEGDPAGSVYVVHRGQVLVTDASGERSEVGAGGVVGAESVLGHPARSATVAVGSDSAVLELAVDALQRLSVDYPELELCILNDQG